METDGSSACQLGARWILLDPHVYVKLIPRVNGRMEGIHKILFGALVGVLGLLVFHKKKMARKTFLWIVIGIMLLTLLLSVLVMTKTEGFQITPKNTSTICTASILSYSLLNGLSVYTGVIWISLLNGEDTGYNTSNTDPNVTIGDVVGDFYNNDKIPIYKFPSSKLRNWVSTIRYLYFNGCYDRMIHFFIWMASCNTLIFPYKYTHPNFTAGVAGLTITDPLDVSRLQNFKLILQDEIFRNAITKQITTDYTIAPSPWSSVSNIDPKQRFPSNDIHVAIFRLLQYWIILRSQQNNETIYIIGAWLERALSFARTYTERHMGFQFYLTNIAGILASYTRAADNPVTDARPFCENLIYYITGKQLENGKLANPTNPSDATDPFTTYATYVNRIPGFIFEACTSDSAVNMRHTSYIYLILFSIFIMRNFAGNIILPKMRCGTVSGGVKIFTNTTVSTILDDDECVRGIVSRILNNICADYLVRIELRKKSMPTNDFHILMRNYLGDPNCLQPVNINSILEQIRNPQYSTKELSPTATGPMFSNTTILEYSISQEIKRIIYKTNLDENNITWYSNYLESKSNTNKNLPKIGIIAGDTPSTFQDGALYNTGRYILGLDKINVGSSLIFDIDMSGNHWTWRGPRITTDLSIPILESIATKLKNDRNPIGVDPSIL